MRRRLISRYVSGDKDPMCESSVYILKGVEKKMIMPEAAKVVSSSDSVICIAVSGERETLQGAWIAEADLMRHEILLKSRKG